ncbi:unnamed protein product, partial [Rotaria sp. Silwood2]
MCDDIDIGLSGGTEGGNIKVKTGDMDISGNLDKNSKSGGFNLKAGDDVGIGFSGGKEGRTVKVKAGDV